LAHPCAAKQAAMPLIGSIRAQTRSNFKKV
jgi:hypothetical protein